MKRLIQLTSILFISNSLIWSCEKGARNPLADDGTKLEKGNGERPTAVFMEQPFPNPFYRSRTTDIDIRYGLPQTMRVTLTVENIIGDVILVLVDGEQPAGFFSIKWNAKNAAGELVKADAYMAHLTTAIASQRKLFEIRD